MLHLNSEETRLFEHVLEGLTHSLESKAIRFNAAKSLLKLLNADQFASFVWSYQQKAFIDGIGINMSQQNLQQYSDVYQYQDPITHKLQCYKRAVSVNEVMEQNELLKTAFYNDFLRTDGLYWGINLYAYAGDDNIGDMRIWRCKDRGNFTERELRILDAIRMVFSNSLRNAQPNQEITEVFSNDSLMKCFHLTPREAEITRAIFEGKMDERIAADLNISFSTVRTHLKNIYRKLSVCNRASLVNLILSSK